MTIKKKMIWLLSCAFVVTAILFIVDYFNIPSKLGIRVESINKDFWTIAIGNFVVITLYLITFFLFDKRNLEKDKLAVYAGYCLLRDSYRDFSSILEVLRMYQKNVLDRNITSDVRAFLESKPLSNDEKIFSALSNGVLSKELYDAYSSIKQDYSSLVVIVFLKRTQPELEKELMEDLTKEIKNQSDKIEQLMEDSK